MAAGDFITFRIWKVVGGALVPELDALANGLAFTAFHNRAGTSRLGTAPALVRLVSNLYGFQPTTAQIAEGIAYVIGTGSLGFPTRYSGALHTDEQPFAAFLLTNQATGALWAGAAPTLDAGNYVAPGGTARTPPSVPAAAGAYLYTVTPSAADLLVGVSGFLTMPSGADPSPAPSFSFAVSSAVDPAVAGAPTPSPQYPQTITFAEVSSRDIAARVTLGSVSTSIARVQSTHEFVRDHAGESFQAAYKIHAPPSCTVGLQHRLWLPSEGDVSGVASQARRILKVAKMRDGSGAVRFVVIHTV